jgi:hypothetical protein
MSESKDGSKDAKRFVAPTHETTRALIRLGNAAKTMWLVLALYVGWKSGRCWPGYKRIHIDHDLSHAFIARGISELIEAGLLERRKRFARSTVYFLKGYALFQPSSFKSGEMLSTRETPVLSKPESISPSLREQNDHQGNNNHKNHLQPRNEQHRHTTLRKPKPTKRSTAPSTKPGTPEGDDGRLVVAVPEGQEEGSPTTTPPSSQAQLLDRPSVRCGSPLLKEIGVDQAVARSLAAQQPVRRIYDVAQAAKSQSNPGGWARKALEDDWTVPAANGDGLAKLTTDLEREAAARDATWARAGGMLKRAPDFPSRLPGESEHDHMARADAWLKAKKRGDKTDSEPGKG